MPLRRVALIFDEQTRPETTGVYCRRALESLVDVVHFSPQELSQIAADDFGLYLNIDDGLKYLLPKNLRPAAWWAIDTHIDFDGCLTKAADFDFVFAAQRDGADRLRANGIEGATWLPLACDPDVHRPYDVPKEFDACFIGNLFPGPRAQLVRLLEQHFRTLVAKRYFEEMARAYSASKVVFNRSIENDVNMRVFEALACGTLLLTNDLRSNGQAALFADGVHLATYCGSGDDEQADLLDKMSFYVRRDDVRQQVAACGRAEVLEKHTYRHRMMTLLTEVERCLAPVSRSKMTRGKPSPRRILEAQSSSTSLTQPSTSAAKEPAYFEHARPELLQRVPPSAERVLEIGCGGGRLGQALKARQDVEVVGIEYDSQAASAADQRLDRVIVGDVETLSLDFPAEHFDCLICGDVLEHLEDPETVLRRVLGWLTRDACVIASIPNARHHSVIGSLLEGNWTYEPAGLLDNTHLHFFTRCDVEQLFAATGYEIGRIDIVPGPGYEEWQRQGRGGNIDISGIQLRGLSAAEAEEFFVYQFLVTASPSSHARLSRHHERETRASSSIDRAPATTGAEQLGCVLAIRNRPPEYLERTLQSFAYQTIQPGDKLLLNYGSTLRLTRAYGRLCQRYGWRQLRVVPRQTRWNLSAAYNHAVAALDEQVTVVFKSDVDVLLGESVLETALQEGRERLCIFSCQAACEDVVYPEQFREGDDLRQWCEIKAHTAPMDGEGIHAFPREWFQRIGGFDLRFEGWGYEDSDLRLRAERSIGLARPAKPLLVHQWHPRVVHQELAARNRAYYEATKQNEVIVRNGGQLLPPTESTGLAKQDSPEDSQQPPCDLNDIDFVVKTFLRPRALRRLLTSVRRYYPSANVVIADDGDIRHCNDDDSRGCCELIDGDVGMTLYCLPFGYGPAEGRNFLVEHTEAPFVLLLDDDYCLTEETRIETLLPHMQDPSIGVVGGLCLDFVEETQRLRRFSGTLEIRQREIVHTLDAWRDRERTLCDIVLQFALFRREVFHDVRWEGGSGAHHYDLFLQLQETDWNVCQEDAVVIHHYPRTPALPGYRQRRDNVGPNQQWLLDQWDVDRLAMSGQVVCARSSPGARRRALPLGTTADMQSESLEPPVPLPDGLPFHDWSISRYCWEVVRRLLRPGMRTLECGSGLSTLLFEAAGCRHTALEHDAARAAASGAVVVAPLVGSPPWYDWRPSERFDVIFVDGPPQSIGRRGLLRVLADCLHEETIVVLDDTNRKDEQLLAGEISQRFGFEGREYHGNRRGFTVFTPQRCPTAIETTSQPALAACEKGPRQRQR